MIKYKDNVDEYIDEGIYVDGITYVIMIGNVINSMYIYKEVMICVKTCNVNSKDIVDDVCTYGMVYIEGIVISNNVIGYVDIMLEDVSWYSIVIIGNIDIISIIIVCECIVLVVVINSVMIYKLSNVLDGIGIDGNMDSNSIYVLICICIVNDCIVIVWEGINVYSYSYVLLDVYIIICCNVFIDVQCKEYLYYVVYVNECIYVGIMFMMLLVHSVHVCVGIWMLMLWYNGMLLSDVISDDGYIVLVLGIDVYCIVWYMYNVLVGIYYCMLDVVIDM